MRTPKMILHFPIRIWFQLEPWTWNRTITARWQTDMANSVTTTITASFGGFAILQIYTKNKTCLKNKYIHPHNPSFLDSGVHTMQTNISCKSQIVVNPKVILYIFKSFLYAHQESRHQNVCIRDIIFQLSFWYHDHIIP